MNVSILNFLHLYGFIPFVYILLSHTSLTACSSFPLCEDDNHLDYLCTLIVQSGYCHVRCCECMFLFGSCNVYLQVFEFDNSCCFQSP